MSVNFSLHQFAYADLPALIPEVLQATGVEASSLKIEITESDMMQNPEAVTEVLQQLESQRVQTCLDDFGTGYSSLSYLQQLPISFLKIDQSFVQRLGADDDALAIVKTILVLAHQLGRQVIAEGVETAEHLSILRIARLRVRARLLVCQAAAQRGSVLFPCLRPPLVTPSTLHH